MSKCMTCKYALYDGMCLAQGKFTLLDAQACDDYKPRIDFEASQLKAENAKLRELVRDMWHEGAFAPGACYVETDRLEERTRELGIEVDA